MTTLLCKFSNVVAAPATSVENRSPAVAFYYANDIPPELSVYDAVVVQPEALAGKNLGQHALAGKLFAYVSVGEVESNRPYFKAIPREWLVGENKDWKSAVVNQSVAGWPEFYVREVITPLWQQGFRGFFLDTLDSYQLIAKNDAERHKQEEGLIALIRAIKKAYPDAKLIFNRGFEILPQVHDLAYVVVAESLFQGWDNGKHKFIEVKAEDRDWLLGQLNVIRNEYHLPVIIIDYAPANDRKKMRRLADQISALGFIPWVTTPAIDAIGIGAHEIIPRRVLMLYDMRDSSGDILASANRFLSMPLNYLGLVPVLHDAADPLPSTPLVGRYAGIVLWFGPGNDAHGDAIHEWLLKQRRDGVPIAVLNGTGMPMDGAHLDVFDLKPVQIPSSDTVVSIDAQGEHTGFEISPKLSIGSQLLVNSTHPNDVWLRLKIGDDQTSEPVAITDWGGYALAPHAAVQLPGGLGMRWMIDPFAFLTAALQLPELPVPDVTTEKGKRLLITHIDGDGFANLAEFPGGHYAGEILRDQILRRYRIPTTVSVIQGEVAANGAYPKLSPKLEPIARSIFRAA
ncbi:MAG: endo alpha-1,4 polygalactosaminidase [Gammaproteobacteria bacterium]